MRLYRRPLLASPEFLVNSRRATCAGAEKRNYGIKLWSARAGATPMTPVTQKRLQLIAAGFSPIPVYGKNPAPEGWQKYDNVSAEMVEMWDRAWPDARNTGLVTRRTPAIDIDIVDPEAAAAIEGLA